MTSIALSLAILGKLSLKKQLNSFTKTLIRYYCCTYVIGILALSVIIFDTCSHIKKII